ncbi:MAG: hypothetical protein ABI866_05315 [Dokdonella sp.]
MNFLALVAVECEVPGAPPVTTLDRATASILADALAHDLAVHVPEIRGLDFVFVGALYDQAQLLRPQWPLHAALADALDRLPRGADSAHVIALGSHEGRLPLASLEPDAGLFGSPMLVMPWLLSGAPATIDKVGQRLERELLEQGLIGAELALAIGEAFGIKTAHARHLTTLDLCAMACAQYEHAELGEIWRIIEAALLKPDQEQRAVLGDGSTLRYRAGGVECDSSDRRRLAHCRAILAAHGLELIAPQAIH